MSLFFISNNTKKFARSFWYFISKVEEFFSQNIMVLKLFLEFCLI